MSTEYTAHGVRDHAQVHGDGRITDADVEAAMAGAARRVALLIEKPHCTSLRESRELRAACARRGVDRSRT